MINEYECCMLYLTCKTKNYLNNQDLTKLIHVCYRGENAPYTNFNGLYNTEDDVKSLKERGSWSLPIFMACKSSQKTTTRDLKCEPTMHFTNFV